MTCQPDTFDRWYYQDQYGHYCNCENVDCKSQIIIIQEDIALKKQDLDTKRANLLRQIARIDERQALLDEKAEKVKSVLYIVKMKPLFKRMQLVPHYKATRDQATSALKKIEKYARMTKRVRRNVNYKAPLGGGLGLGH